MVRVLLSQGTGTASIWESLYLFSYFFPIKVKQFENTEYLIVLENNPTFFTALISRKENKPSTFLNDLPVFLTTTPTNGFNSQPWRLRLWQEKLKHQRTTMDCC